MYIKCVKSCLKRMALKLFTNKVLSSGISGSEVVEVTWKTLEGAVIRKCTDLIKMLKPCGESWSFRINRHKTNKSAHLLM
jgi:hypothetical protein